MENISKKILMVAYYFPPLGGSGALRPLKIAKHLPKYGWQPIIITAKNPDWYYAYDPDLLNELSSGIKIFKSLTVKAAWIYRLLNPLKIEQIDNIIKSYFLIPDEHIGWLLAAYFSAKAAVKKFNPQSIYSTSGPMTCHLIAYLLKKKTGLPWIADFRDEWLEDPKLNLPTPFHRKFHFLIEKLIVNEADKITCMAPMYEKCLAKHVNSRNKLITIPAGFDPDDIIAENFSNKTLTHSQKCILTFTGLFYETFRPKALLRAVSELITEKKIAKDEIEIKFVGANSFKDLGCKDKFKICKFTGFLPRKKAIEHAANSNVLLLLLSNERGRDVIPSKIFEYLALKKSILAIVPSNGEVANIVRKTKSGIVADFDNVNEIKRAILRLYSEWQKGELEQKQDIKEINKYNQVTLVGKVADILNNITE
jgi:glycosyltransferase involved in cell wall biosynthesis